MAKEYIEERAGSYYVAGTRISLDSIPGLLRERRVEIRAAIDQLVLIWAASVIPSGDRSDDNDQQGVSGDSCDQFSWQRKKSDERPTLFGDMIGNCNLQLA
jgi:hypothetical protein